MTDDTADPERAEDPGERPEDQGERPELGPLLDAVVAALPGGVPREGQRRMAEAVAHALDTGEHLLVQAGTGTGKSVAYLVPALRSGETVVVSTATLALQRQLVDVDLPLVVDALESQLGRRPDVALLKGRANYLCRLRLSEGEAPADDAEALIEEAPTSAVGAEVTRLRRWAEETDTGDRDDLGAAVSDRAWRLVSVSARECVGAHRCPYGDECFSELARERARLADLVVTNHSLLALDVLTEGKVLPPHSAVVVDEAHELAAKTTDQAAAALTPVGLRVTARRAGPHVGDQTAVALDDAVAGLVGEIEAAPLGRLAPVPDHVADALRLARTAALAAAREVDGDGAAQQQAKAQLDSLAATAERIAGDTPADVIWVEADDRGRRSLCVAPLDVSRTLLEGLFGRRTVVGTSATLALGGDFAAVARQLGLPAAGVAPAWRGLDVGSPFDYARQGILYVAAHLPEPGRAGTPAEVTSELRELIEAAGGRTLGLFSSMRAAREAAEVVRATSTVPVLVQGEEPLRALVRRFRDDPRTCLFGTLSLWQGVDVPGDACQLVVIDRIPFPRPDDPLYAAREDAARRAGQNGFMAVAVPHAALLLAQAAGRLVRRSTDRGVVAVLDPRLATRRYGDFLSRSLPGFWPTRDPAVVRAALRRLDDSAGSASGQLPVGSAAAR